MISQAYFKELVQELNRLTPNDRHFFFNLTAEETQFIRFNASKVRQIGSLLDAEGSITWIRDNQATATQTVTLTGKKDADFTLLNTCIQSLENETQVLPIDPFVTFPEAGESSEQEKVGRLLPYESATETLLNPLGKVDLAGIYASGKMIRGMAHSKGVQHWFASEIFSFDYSIYNSEQKAVKGTYAGSDWNEVDYKRSIQEAIQKLEHLNKPSKKLSPGAYRVYLEPAALGDILQMFSWGCISEQACRKGSSPLRLKKNFSPLFTLEEDFSQGAVPRFNDQGKLSPMNLPLIQKGLLKNTLISERSAQEYQLPANGANDSESLQSPKIQNGSLLESEKLNALGTGVWISNLHYLNWSEMSQGRITGMTRYACLWVENGKPIGPIENIRFDDSIFNILGTELESVSASSQFLPEVGSYDHRALGGTTVPGILVRAFQFKG